MSVAAAIIKKHKKLRRACPDFSGSDMLAEPKKVMLFPALAYRQYELLLFFFYYFKCS